MDPESRPTPAEGGGRFRRHTVVWTPEKVSRFWDFQSAKRTNEYFSASYAADLAAEVIALCQPTGTVLDVGCGPGHLLAELHRRGVAVAGLDPSVDTIDAARARLSEVPADRLRVGSASPLPFEDGSIDAVLYVEVIEHLLDTELDRLFAEAIRVLRPGGRIFITTPNDEDLESQSVLCPDCGAVFHVVQHVRSWNAASLTGTLTRHGFVDIRTRARRLVPSGTRMERFLRRVWYAARRERPFLLAVASRRA